MSGKLVGIFLAAVAVFGAGALYYLQVFHFYERLDPAGVEIALTREGGEPVPIEADVSDAIDASSSPIRFRACFDTDLAPDEAAGRFLPAPGAVPLNAPFWFDCFDADAIGAALEAGEARAFMGRKNIAYGVDRIVVLTGDGRGYAWQQLNGCGEIAYDGSPVGEACPPREDFE